MFVGKHAISDIEFDVDIDLTSSNSTVIINAMSAAVRDVGATIMSVENFGFGENEGFTATLILAESHMSIHTWPEYNLATVDIFMCGDCDAFAALEFFYNYLESAELKFVKKTESKINRGWVNVS